MTSVNARNLPQRGGIRKALVLAACVALIPAGGCQRADVDRQEPAVPEPAATELKAERLEQNAAAGVTVPPVAELIKKPEAQGVDPTGAEPMDDAITCLARTIYWEARGESTASMESVANVVMNRLGHADFPNTICEVVTQGRESGACQFSWWCDGRSDHAREDEAYAVAKEVARKALNRQLPDRTDGALYFHHRAMTPGWAATYAKTAEMGDFVFYKPQSDT